MNLSDAANCNIKSADYRCIISRISKSEAINLMQNIHLTTKNRTLQNIKTYQYKLIPYKNRLINFSVW